MGLVAIVSSLLSPRSRGPRHLSALRLGGDTPHCPLVGLTSFEEALGTMLGRVGS